MGEAMQIHTEIKRTAFISGPALQSIFQRALGAPAGSGIWLRAELSEDETSVLSMQAEWIERGEDINAEVQS